MVRWVQVAVFEQQPTQLLAAELYDEESILPHSSPLQSMMRVRKGRQQGCFHDNTVKQRGETHRITRKQRIRTNSTDENSQAEKNMLKEKKVHSSNTSSTSTASADDVTPVNTPAETRPSPQTH